MAKVSVAVDVVVAVHRRALAYARCSLASRRVRMYASRTSSPPSLLFRFLFDLRSRFRFLSDVRSLWTSFRLGC